MVLLVFFMQFFLKNCIKDQHDHNYYKLCAWPNFRLTHLTFRPQKRDKQVEHSGHQFLLEPFSSLVSKCAIHRNCLRNLYLLLRAVLKGWPPPPTKKTLNTCLNPPMCSCSFSWLLISWKNIEFFIFVRILYCFCHHISYSP